MKLDEIANFKINVNKLDENCIMFYMRFCHSDSCSQCSSLQNFEYKLLVEGHFDGWWLCFTFFDSE